ncbi:hypothetical protein LUZ61_015174 [Rhynchospora tenuis]|uniref:Glycosyltransferase 61 catalytic domain-containing protein n=1 Tax=Rhynchospora tenuis TaxID=198213 RepID=A0AAD5WCM0_9POAL|nr:hypothetical protein LUZ61_015174 [Rhynchospora tenuis]
MFENYKDHKKRNMKGGGGILGRHDTQKFGCNAMAKCLLFGVVVLSVLNPAVLPHSVFPRKWTTNLVNIEEKPKYEASYSEHTKLTLRLIAKTEDQNGNKTTTGSEASTSLPESKKEKQEKAEEKIEIKDTERITRIDISMSSFDSQEKQKENELEKPMEKEPPTGSSIPVESSETKQSQETSPSLSLNEIEKQGENNSRIDTNENKTSPIEKMQESSLTTTEVIVNKSKLIYNSANPRYNICSIEGDIRVVPDASTIFIVSPAPLYPNTTTWKIKPYPRKWEFHTMEAISEMTIQQLTDANQARSCDVTHDLPAVVFSSARFMGNLFHDYTDMIYPLFLATHRYNGEVKLLVKDYVAKSIEKYQPYLTRLSHYPIINLDTETSVHCFSSAQVGLENPGPLGYKFQNPQNDQAMQQFRHFIRESLSLGRSEVERGKKPRLLILLRKNTRAIINEDDVINMAKDVGFEVVTADVETTQDFPRIAHIVNSCDILMGIHGAGLGNMLYLPTNGTVLQILPYGELKWVGRFDYGDPPRGFGLRYVEYEITLEESSLLEKYPRDHPVIADPQSIHKKGWQEVYVVYLYEQNVKLDSNRFRGTLEDVFQSYQ